MEEDGRIVEELVWERLLEYSDSGQFKCTAFNSNGTSSAALNISVIRKYIYSLMLYSESYHTN